MDNEYSKIIIDAKNTKKNSSNFFTKIIATTVAGTICCTSIGLGIGFGTSYYRDNFSTSTPKVSTTIATNASTNSVPIKAKISQLVASNNTSFSSAREVVDAVKDSVVSINVKSASNNSNNFYSTYATASAGSGIIISEDSSKIYVATNNHVITGGTTVTISLDDKTQIPAHYVGSDASVDLAVIYVLKTDLQKVNATYKIATLAKKGDYQVGDVAIAIGNALGQGKTATEGIISALGKKVQIEGTNLTVLQTDAAINPGNSGGALVNAKAEVIGINTAKLSNTSTASVEGFGYSIPIDVAIPILQGFINNGTVAKPYLGIQGVSITDDIMKQYYFPSKGVYIEYIDSGSGADKGGLKVGDLVVGVNGTTISTTEELGKMIDNTKVGDIIKLKVIRGKQIGELSLVMGNANGENF